MLGGNGRATRTLIWYARLCTRWPTVWAAPGPVRSPQRWRSRRWPNCWPSRRSTTRHIGDSRAYLLRGDKLTQLTQDHSLVAEMVRDGRLAADEARLHPYRSILSRALGTEPDAEVDELRVDLLAGDVLLLCSDGLSGPVPLDKLRKGLAAGDPEKAARRLVDEALRHGGPDNVTVVVVQLLDGAAGGESDATETLVLPAEEPDRDSAPDPQEAAAGDAEAVADPLRRRHWPWSRRSGASRAAAPEANG